MTLNLIVPQETKDLRPRITVFGVGGAGGNAVNNMIAQALQGVEFVVANTDAQALGQSRSALKIQLGERVTEGLGAGAKPAIGAAAAEESLEQIVEHLVGAHMCFITAGMGGGTGTGAAPIIAQAARELGVLTVGVVTKPFQFEGAKRMRQAEEGIEALQKVVDTLIIIPNQNLFRLANERTTFTEAFAMADDVLYQGVKGVTDLMVRPGLINLDFADVRSVMDEMGKAMMGTGEATGEARAVQAAEKAIANPLLDEISLNGARGVLINVTGGYDMTLFELDEAANIIRDKVDPDANIIVGSTLEPEMEGAIRVSVVATGIDTAQARRPVPQVPTAPAAARPVGGAFAPGPAATHGGAMAPAAGPTPAVPTAPAPVAVSAGASDLAPAAHLSPGAARIEAVRAAVRPVSAADTFGRRPEPAPAATAAADLFAATPSRLATTEIIGADEVPPPAYQPRVGQNPLGADAASFVAPSRAQPGVPTLEEIRRLQAAVNRAPVSRTTTAAPLATPRADDKSRFAALGSLINRMAGGATPPLGTSAAGRRPGATQDQQDSAVPERGADHGIEAAPEHDHERVEIPAFLRRQAN
jgi:cell division protein FtsZ